MILVWSAAAYVLTALPVASRVIHTDNINAARLALANQSHQPFDTGARTDARTGGHCACSAGVKLVACTMVRNEMAWLPEWIAYHHAIGIEKFVIYNDKSSDGVGSLAKLYSARNVTIDVEVLPALGRQRESFSDCVKRNQDASWVGIFDVDEFIVVKRPPGEACSANDSLRCLLQGVKQGQVHFQELRFGSGGQVRNFDIRLEGTRLRKPLDIRKQPKVNKSLVEQSLNCSRLELSDDQISVQGPPCLNMGPRRSDGRIPTLTQSHVWRQANPYSAEALKARAERRCTDPSLKKAASGWKICSAKGGKSFVQPALCSRYGVHGCAEPEHLGVKGLSLKDAQLNHYFLRSAEEACKKSLMWHKVDPLVAYQAVDKSFFHSVQDHSALDLVPDDALQRELGKLECS
mmetsp:Transcript_110577/g.323562  ORF Transcript_110577/g.323562 Transcript_110577/m.323562 type:complete len:405 (-) Transcript_110577:159-1373(-)